jgi:hypothetical protein
MFESISLISFNIYNLLLAFFSIYILYNLLLKSSKKPKSEELQTSNYIKLYFDKLFIIKVIRLVKENLTLSARLYNIRQELKAYFNVKSAIIFQNINIYCNYDESLPNFVAVEHPSEQNNLDLNQCYNESLEGASDKANQGKIFYFTNKQNEEEYAFFSLWKDSQLIGALVLLKSQEAVFEQNDLDTIWAICSLIELILFIEFKTFDFKACE